MIQKRLVEGLSRCENKEEEEKNPVPLENDPERILVQSQSADERDLINVYCINLF